MLRSLTITVLTIASCISCTLAFAPGSLLVGQGHELRSMAARVGPCKVVALYGGAGNADGRKVLCPPLRAQTMKRVSEDGKDWNRYVKEGLELPLSSKRKPEGPLEEDPVLPMIEDIIVACDERKAENIWAARVAHLTYTTSFFVNAEGTSRPMLQAIAASVENMMGEKYERDIKWQGNPDSGWILLDYGEVIVNVMTPAARKFYDLENLWRNGELIPLDRLIKPSMSSSSGSLSIEDDDWGSADPFSKWDNWDEGQDLTPSEKVLMTKEGIEDDETD